MVVLLFLSHWTKFVTACPDELTPDQYWLSRHQVHEHSTDTVADSTSDDENVESLFQDTTPTQVWKGHLRPQPCEDALGICNAWTLELVVPILCILCISL